ncbi:hypothetical protein [Pseudidiomarina woesei]|nr:hypothetical protein [Pseudidiomarina woesei]
MHYSRGYLSTLMIPVLAGLLALFVGIASSQHEIQKRWHLQSAADAMVLSAATIMAREMNILAVFNRAIVANQVAQAQLLGLSSWYSNIDSASERLALVTFWVPYVNAVTAQLSRIIATIDRPLQQLIQIGLALQETLITAIQLAQVTVRFSFAQIIPESLAQLARLQNIESEQWSLVHSPGLVNFPWLWWTFIPLQSATNDDERLANLIRRSRDPFSKSRTFNWFNAGLVKGKKAGGTELVISSHGDWSWQALDTVAVHIDMLFRREEIPWGNGVSYRGERIGRADPTQFGASARTNPRATQWALTDQVAKGRVNSSSYFDRDDLSAAEWPKVLLIFEQAVAKAGVRYSRPASVFPRADNKPEKANLYNALWQPELQQLTTAEKLMITQFRAAQS